MGAKNKADAKDNFAGFFKETLSCVSDAYLQPVQISLNRFILTYEPPAIVLCRAGERTLDISQTFRIGKDEKRGGFKAITLHYDYTLNAKDGDAWRELVSYHWHPDETEVRVPHLHVGCECFPRVHFPTRRISIERFLLMLFDYYEVEPLLDETECRRILGKNNKAFEQMSSWG